MKKITRFLYKKFRKKGYVKGLCKNCKYDEVVERYNKCEDCGGYVHFCPRCNPLIYCKCCICEKCNKKTYNGKYRMNPEYCMCGRDYHKTLQKMKRNISCRRKSAEMEWKNLTFPCTYRKFDPAGLVYYLEIEIINMGTIGSGYLGIVESAGIFKLMHDELNDICCYKETSVYWSDGQVRISYPSGGLFSSANEKSCFTTGDTIGMKLSNNKKVVTLTKNGEVVGIIDKEYDECEIGDLYFPNFSFYVNFVDADIRINDSTRFNELKFQNLKPFISIIRNKLNDIQIKTI